MAQNWRWIPNALTFLRILLIVPFAVALWNSEYRVALIIFFIAAATDAFDGSWPVNLTGARGWAQLPTLSLTRRC